MRLPLMGRSAKVRCRDAGAIETMYSVGGRLTEWPSADCIGGDEPNNQRVVGDLLVAEQESRRQEWGQVHTHSTKKSTKIHLK